jgi:hypothetical protein
VAIVLGQKMSVNQNAIRCKRSLSFDGCPETLEEKEVLQLVRTIVQMLMLLTCMYIMICTIWNLAKLLSIHLYEKAIAITKYEGLGMEKS